MLLDRLAVHPSTSQLRAPRGFAWAAALMGLLIAGCASTMMAPEARAQSEGEDPPARVGSVSALRGPVDASTEAGAAWQPAQINQPVTSQTALFAPAGSQAEVRIGSTSVRLDGNTQAIFSQVDDHAVVLDVAQGTVRARVRSLPGGDQFMLVADGVRAEAQGPGDYRVSYDPDRRAYTVRALSGRMRVVTPGNSFNLESGQETLVEAGGNALQLRAMGQRDEFDAWAEGRDRDQDRLASARYVSPEMTGIEALDAHGRWDVVGEYGAVWYPRALPYGWAPYRYGRWAWVRPWGWTWVDDAPWGFAPFHYGRWAQIGGTWGWVPGPVVPRPVWAPALVGYVGGSGGVNVSIGFGNGRPIGWFPLGPREVYHPPYRYGPRYAQQVNVINVNTTVINNPPPNDRDRRVTQPPMPGGGAYRYARQPDAVTMVNEDQFRGARSIGRDRLNLTPQQAAALQPVMVAPPSRGQGGPGGAPGGPQADPGLPRAALPQPLPGRDPRDGVGRFVPRSEDNGSRGRFVPQGEPAAPFERGRRREAVPDAPVYAQPSQPSQPVPQAAAPQAPLPQAAPPVQAQIPPPVAADPRFQGRRNDERFNNEDRDGRGSFGRGMPQRPPQSAPEPARALPPAQIALPNVAPAPQLIPRPVPVPNVAPAPQMIPRPVPVPMPQAVPQPQPQPEPPPRMRSRDNPNRDADETPGQRGGPRER